ncbi:MAG: radical SAM protein [Nitrospinota bacterium]|nr:radical SAM protein [Nitrospinota bacterium]
MYDFYGRLNAEFPSQVIVDITEACNLACVHCPHSTFKASKHFANRNLEYELNEKIVDEVRANSNGAVQFVRYASEGESLIHPKAYEMIQYAVENSGTLVTLTTNGTILNEKKLQPILDAGINLIDFSVDALSPEVYSQIRRGGELERTQENIFKTMRMIKSSNSKTLIAISFIEQPENAHEATEFQRFWKEKGADFVYIRRLHSAAGAINDMAEAMRKNNESVKRKPCLYPWERIVLNPRGFLAFCPADWTHGSTMTDYRSTTIKESWQGEFYRNLRKAHLSNSFENHSFCGQCPDWVATRWPDEGRSYANMMEEINEES